MASINIIVLLALHISMLLVISSLSAAEEKPTVNYDFDVSYIIASPLGIPQQVIAVNDEFPGPVINVTTDQNVIVKVRNNLDESFLMTWPGIFLSHTSSQDGVLGTNCPIPPGLSWTYTFLVNNQTGSFFYFPSINFQRASGGFGAFSIRPRPVTPVPFPTPEDDIVILIGDWYIRDHKALRKTLSEGKSLGIRDGVLINGKGPYKYNDSIIPDGIDYETINVLPGKTYRLRVYNVGISTSLNFRIQKHSLVLAEVEGSYTMLDNYTNMDIHVGQSYSFLLTTSEKYSSDYYIVASARFINQTDWHKVTGVAVLRYLNSREKAHGPLPRRPSDKIDMIYSMVQSQSIKWNVTASGASRPNSQSCLEYYNDFKNKTDVYVIENKPPVTIDGKNRTTLNGISFQNLSMPIMLADKYKVKGVYRLDIPHNPMTGPPRLETSIITASYKGFMEIIFQNNDTKIQTYHLDGYDFVVLGMDFGQWTENSRETYRTWNVIPRTTAQVYPGAWTAILVFLNNEGVWNLRTENLDSCYLGQQTYIRVVNPELPEPDDDVFNCTVAH